MSDDVRRQTGRTTRQILHAPAGATYVWLNHNFGYLKALCAHLGRTDLVLVSEHDFNRPGYLHGKLPVAVVVDHASSVDTEALFYLRSRNIQIG